MIRMVQSASAGHAKAYFSDALLKSDYYIDDQELQGRLLGKLGERLGVNGTATKDTFFALCENVNPATGRPLTPRTKAERTTGYDINFHCPKSVSIVHALSKDDHILKAFESSIRETMLEIEADTKTRVRKNNTYEDRATGELVWAEFVHQTARPVDGHVPDPHLHGHCFVFNATWDDAEKRIKAGQFRDIKRDMPYYQTVFHKKFSDRLIDAGYAIRRTDKSFEIEGVPKSAIDLFSKRTDEIGRVAKEQGITDARELSELGARTRSKKQKGLSMDELKAEWRSQIRGHTGYKEGEADKAVRHAQKVKEPPEVCADHCVDYALNHSFERASVMEERRLLETAFQFSVGNRHIDLKDIELRFKSDERIIHVKEGGHTMCTKRDVLKEEMQMVRLARQGLGRFEPICRTVPQLKDEKLNTQQRAAIEHVLTTRHGVSIVRGAAGTGKTRLMQEADLHFKEAGKKMLVVAPTAQASRGILAKDGFTDADTVAGLLIDQKKQEALYGQVLWVDEAGLLGTKDMTALLSLAQKQNARLILGGDTRQHAAVVRGDALRILNTVGGIRTSEVSEIMRQKTEAYRSAVKDLSQGDVRSGFEKLDGMGAIKAVDAMKANDELVNDYMAAIKQKKSVLIVSPTNKQGEAVTDEVRTRLRASGLIGKKELSARKLFNLNLTEAEKSDWRNFEKGQVVQFNQNVPKIGRGSVWKVKDVEPQKVTLQNSEGEERLLPGNKPAAYDVYQENEVRLSKNDKVRITRNGFDERGKRLDNGDALVVAAVSKSGKIKLVNKASKASFILDKDFGHLTHDYCTTSYSSQGKTVDQVLISQPASTFSATDAKQFYVSVSRGREAVTIYTDDKAELLERASEMGDRQSALELVGEKGKWHIDYVERLEREAYGSKAIRHQPKEKAPITIERKIDYEPEL